MVITIEALKSTTGRTILTVIAISPTVIGNCARTAGCNHNTSTQAISIIPSGLRSCSTEPANIRSATATVATVAVTSTTTTDSSTSTSCVLTSTDIKLVALLEFDIAFSVSTLTTNVCVVCWEATLCTPKLNVINTS